MGTEVELKLLAEGADALAELETRSRLGPMALGPARTIGEVDRYLDTDDGRLAAARWACRLRTRDGSVTVSLKGPAAVSPLAWVHRRPEVEGPATAALESSAWPDSPARTLLDSLAGGRPLSERLRLVQRRTERAVMADGRTLGTLSLDTVTVEAERRRLGVFHVVELELRSGAAGDEELTGQLASALLAVPGLHPDPQSKLEHALSMLSPEDDPAPAETATAASAAARRGEGHAWGRLALLAMGIYMAVLLTLIVASGFWPTIDLVAIGLAALAIILGRGRLFFRDWVPFVLVFLGWEAMRGLADNFGAGVHSDGVIALERAISFGIVPPVELQRLLYRPDAVNPLDIATSALYAAHFIFPLGIAFIFWMRDRSLYYRFAGTLLLMALAAFVVYLLVPVAPPRFAHLHGEALAVVDVMGETIVKLEMHPSADWVYQNLSPNDNAAFPSLHAAFPLLAWLFLRRRHPTAARIVAVYTLAVWFAIVYLGHHYVVDIVGGAAFAIGAYLLVARLGILDRGLAWLVSVRVPQPLRRRSGVGVPTALSGTKPTPRPAPDGQPSPGDPKATR